MRKNIFEMIAEDFDVAQEISSIWDLFIRVGVFIPNKPPFHGKVEKSILECVSLYTFRDWKARSRCSLPYDMMDRLGIDENTIIYLNKFSNETLKVLEFILNMITLCDNAIRNYHFTVSDDYRILKENISIFLEHFGHTTHYFEDKEQVVIIEKNPSAISAAEISEPETGKKIIQYNHYTLKGNVDAKRDIIIALANELEPQRKELSQINSSLESDLFLMFNNLNLRHNNIESSDKNYKPFVAKMEKDTLENWYDDIYQMILLAKLLLDNKERQNRIKMLKDNL